MTITVWRCYSHDVDILALQRDTTDKITLLITPLVLPLYCRN